MVAIPTHSGSYCWYLYINYTLLWLALPECHSVGGQEREVEHGYTASHREALQDTVPTSRLKLGVIPEKVVCEHPPHSNMHR